MVVDTVTHNSWDRTACVQKCATGQFSHIMWRKVKASFSLPIRCNMCRSVKLEVNWEASLMPDRISTQSKLGSTPGQSHLSIFKVTCSYTCVTVSHFYLCSGSTAERVNITQKFESIFMFVVFCCILSRCLPPSIWGGKDEGNLDVSRLSLHRISSFLWRIFTQCVLPCFGNSLVCVLWGTTVYSMCKLTALSVNHAGKHS